MSDSEVLVLFVTPGGECIARNISEWHKIVHRWVIGKINKIINRINVISIKQNKDSQRKIKIRCLYSR